MNELTEKEVLEPQGKNTLKKEISHAFGKDVYLLGCDKDGIKYWLGSPRFDCGWYWGFGYVDTYTKNDHPNLSKDINSHQHIKSSFLFQQKDEYIHNLYDAKLLINTTFTEGEGWELGELFKHFYTLKDAAEIFHNGAGIAGRKVDNTDKKMEDHINQTVLPTIFKRIIEILSPAI